jgi:hypothetical protein
VDRKVAGATARIVRSRRSRSSSEGRRSPSRSWEPLAPRAPALPPTDDAGPVPGVHVDGRSHRRSRKIESREERGRLRGIVREFREAHGFTGGVIIRTAAAGRPKEDISATRRVFTRSGPRCGSATSRRALSWSVQSRASSRLLAIADRGFSRSGSTTHRTQRRSS